MERLRINTFGHTSGAVYPNGEALSPREILTLLRESEAQCGHITVLDGEDAPYSLVNGTYPIQRFCRDWNHFLNRWGDSGNSTFTIPLNYRGTGRSW